METIGADEQQRVTDAVRIILRDMEPVDAAAADEAQYEWIDLDSDRFPVPALLRFALSECMGLKAYGPWEKMRWGFDFLFEGRFYAVQMKKFGLRLAMPVGDSGYSRLLGKLDKSTEQVEKALKQLGQRQADAGNVSVANNFGQLDAAYRFFRELAVSAFQSSTAKSVDEIFQVSQNKRNGFFLGTAMLDAYFSRLEHLFVLLLPFTDFDPAGGNLVRFLGQNWGDKFKEVIDVNQDPVGKRHYDKLKALKERFRNPMSHGGFEKAGKSLYFHVSGLGALPMTLRNRGQFLELGFMPMATATFESLCADLDEFDAFMESSVHSEGVKFVKAGLDVRFDADGRKIYEEAVSTDSLEDLMERLAYEWERHTNMDY